MKSSLDFVREACIKANPKIVEYTENVDTYDKDGYWNGMEKKDVMRPIRLADVLLAMGRSNQGLREVYQLNPNSLSIGRIGGGIFATWNLRNDSLDWHAEHEPKTVDFIASLLK